MPTNWTRRRAKPKGGRQGAGGGVTSGAGIGGVDLSWLEQLPLGRLKPLCKEKGLSISGNQQALAKRLRESGGLGVPQLEALCELVCVAKQGSAAEIGDRLRRIGARLRADSSDREVVLAAVLQDGRALHRLDVLDADNLDAGHLDIRLRAERRPEVPEEHGVSRLAVAVRRVAEPLCRLERVQPPRLPGVPELSDSKRSGSPSSLSKHSAYAPPVPCFCAREADTP